MSDFEDPAIDSFHLCLHLASDDQALLEKLRAHTGPGAGTDPARRQTRTGFVGAGLPASHQKSAVRLWKTSTPGDHVTQATPLFMGFKSGLSKNQASEDAVTIPDGQFAQGTTMAVSYMTLSLDDWYENLTAPNASRACTHRRRARHRWRASPPMPSPIRA